MTGARRAGTNREEVLADEQYPRWQQVAEAYAERIAMLERIAIADQQSYRRLQEELAQAKERVGVLEALLKMTSGVKVP